MGSDYPRYRDSWLVRIGLAAAIAGAMPLLVVLVASWLGLTSDPSPNPVFFGMIVRFTFWPGLLTAAAGAVLVYLRRRPFRKASLRSEGTLDGTRSGRDRN